MNGKRLSKQKILNYINGDKPFVEVFEEIDSTNSQAKRAIKGGMKTDGIFVAEAQTEGRGRRGKSFFSPSGSGLYFSAVLHPEVSLSDSTLITAAAAVIVTKILKEATKKDPKIKWVNDIFIGDKKVCGILAEAVNDFENNRLEAVIVGIGINLTTEEFPEDLKSIAGSIGEADRNLLSARLFEGLKELCDKLPEKAFMDDYRKNSAVIGKRIHFIRNGREFFATAESIDDEGRLIVFTDEKERMALDSGEISVKLK